MCDSGKGETFCERSKKEQSARKISRCARNDGMGGMGLFHAAYNGYVWKALFLYRHPERSRGIFLAEGDNVVCVIAEKGKPFAKGARKSRVQGRFLAALEMTVWGEWVYFTQRTTDMFGKRYSCIVIGSGAEGSFLHTGIAPYV